jgi:hypothetical protein
VAGYRTAQRIGFPYQASNSLSDGQRKKTHDCHQKEQPKRTPKRFCRLMLQPQFRQQLCRLGQLFIGRMEGSGLFVIVIIAVASF